MCEIKTLEGSKRLVEQAYAAHVADDVDDEGSPMSQDLDCPMTQITALENTPLSASRCRLSASTKHPFQDRSVCVEIRHSVSI